MIGLFELVLDFALVLVFVLGVLKVLLWDYGLVFVLGAVSAPYLVSQLENVLVSKLEGVSEIDLALK